MNADLKEKLQFAHVFEEHVYVTDEDLIERIIAGTYDSGRFDGVGKYHQPLLFGKDSIICYRKDSYFK